MITINLTDKVFQINEINFALPILKEDLQKILDCELRAIKAKNNTLFIWDELGIISYSKNGELVDTLSLEYELHSNEFSPKEKFRGKFFFNGDEIIEYYNSHKDEHVKLFGGDSTGALVLNNISAWFSVRDNKIRAIEVAKYQPYDRAAGIPKNKYKITKLDEEEITFVDFGFKVSVIEELMYIKGLLKPQFDIYEFAKWYPHREIDIDEEGYSPIPEVVQYFKDLPIPKRLAAEVTEIYQDGGNDIYMNLAPFSGGYEDYWDIESCEDARHFPNLKKAILCYAKDHIYEEFAKMGIDAESI